MFQIPRSSVGVQTYRHTDKQTVICVIMEGGETLDISESSDTFLEDAQRVEGDTEEIVTEQTTITSDAPSDTQPGPSTQNTRKRKTPSAFP